jgi:hypothetical protein
MLDARLLDGGFHVLVGGLDTPSLVVGVIPSVEYREPSFESIMAR